MYFKNVFTFYLFKRSMSDALFAGEEGIDEGEATEEEGHRRIRQTSRGYREKPNSA